MAYTLEDGYILEKKFLTITGMYPVKSTTIFYYIRSLLAWFLSCAQLVSQLIMMYLEFDDLSKVLSMLYYCMTQTAYICKLANFNLRKHLLVVMEEELKNPLFNTFAREQNKEYLQSTFGSFKKVAKIFRILCVSVIVFYGLFPMVDNNPDNPLPLTGWYPVDIWKYRAYIYVFQVVSVGVSAYNNANIDILTSGLISSASVQFMMLKDNLRNVMEGLQPIKTSRTQLVADLKMNEVVDGRLERCVKHHNDILKFVSHIEAMFSYGIFVQFIATTVVICLTGFQIIMVPPNNVQFLMLLSYFFCMMWQIGMYCWYGHEIIFQSSEISEACYMSNWYECDTYVLKNMYLIMERSKRPVVLTAGNFFNLSLNTFTTILRSSYSYFAVLHRLYKDDFWI